MAGWNTSPHQMVPQGFYPQQPVITQPITSTTVVINDGQKSASRALRPWSTGVCSCFDDCGICLLVTFCGSCNVVGINNCACLNIAGMVMSDEMGENCCLPLCVGNWLVVLRTKLRTQLGIQGSVFDDNCLACFCGSCVHCQVWREYRTARASGELK